MIPISQLSEFVDHATLLAKLGFTPDTAELLGTELRQSGFTPQSASNVLTNALKEYSHLALAVTRLTAEEQKLIQLVDSKKTQEKTLQ